MKTILSIFIFFVFAMSAKAQHHDSLTSKDYAHAESFLFYNTQQYVDNGSVNPHWLSGDRFWYRKLIANGSEFILVNPEKSSRIPAFNQEKIATALSASTGKSYTAMNLPFQTFGFSDDEKSILFKANGKQWKCSLITYQCTPDSSVSTAVSKSNENEILSPDGKKAAFIKEYNLWVRDVSTGKQTPLTTDGEKYFGYATDNAGWKHSDEPILRWSPDSRKIATFQQDERKAGDMYLVTTNVGHPILKAWKYPLPGDTNIVMIQRVIINVDIPKVIRLQMPPDPHRGSLSDDISSSGTFDDVDWSADASQLAFVSTSRDHKQEKFRIADAATGAVKEVFEEVVPHQYESGQGTINWRYLPKTNEIIWYSERDNWAHLYLYNATTGKLKSQITTGNFVVTEITKIDEKNRVLYFLAVGKETGNPYYSHLYKTGFDGKQIISLTPEEGDHRITLSPSEKYFIDSYSQPDLPPVINLRNLNGKLISVLEKTDVSRLKASGWQPTKPITVKAHDGQTDLYGLMFTPTNINANNKYPVIDYIYPGPQGGSVGSWSFSASRGDFQALAELGFVVVLLEGTSNPLRSKSYHDMSYGNMAENTLPDQVAGIRQLAQKLLI